jgi:hypothetical protein
MDMSRWQCLHEQNGVPRKHLRPERRVMRILINGSQETEMD